MAFRGNWPPKHRMMSTFWKSQPLLLCFSKQRISWRKNWCDHVVSCVFWKKVVISKDHSIWKHQKTQGDFRPIFSVGFWRSGDHWLFEKAKIGPGRLRKPSRLMCLANVHLRVFPKIGVPKWSFLVGKPHGCWENPTFLETSMFFFVLKMVHAWCYELCYPGFHRTWHRPHILKGCCGFFGHPGENEITLSLQSCPTPFLNLAVSPALKMAWFIWAWLEVRLGLATSL